MQVDCRASGGGVVRVWNVVAVVSVRALVIHQDAFAKPADASLKPAVRAKQHNPPRRVYQWLHLWNYTKNS